MAAEDQAHHLRCGWHEAGGRGSRRANSQRNHVVNPDWASVCVSSMANSTRHISAVSAVAYVRSCGEMGCLIVDHLFCGRMVSRLCSRWSVRVDKPTRPCVTVIAPRLHSRGNTSAFFSIRGWKPQRWCV